MFFSGEGKGIFYPGIEHISCISCIGRQVFYPPAWWATHKVENNNTKDILAL